MVAKIAVMASGDGSNFEAFVEASRSGDLTAEIVGIVSNRDNVGVLKRAERLRIPAAVIQRTQFAAALEWNAAILGQLKKWQAEWVILAGYTGLIGQPILEGFPNRITNSHPSLLPKFGGKGMYGNRVHEAVVLAGEAETGITVHLLNERFDEGPIVAQKRVPVLQGDTVESLAERVKSAERKFYPTVIQDLLTGRIKSR